MFTVQDTNASGEEVAIPASELAGRPPEAVLPPPEAAVLPGGTPAPPVRGGPVLPPAALVAPPKLVAPPAPVVLPPKLVLPPTGTVAPPKLIVPPGALVDMVALKPDVPPAA
jgi:hypothetical protein